MKIETEVLEVPEVPLLTYLLYILEKWKFKLLGPPTSQKLSGSRP